MRYVVIVMDVITEDCRVFGFYRSQEEAEKAGPDLCISDDEQFTVARFYQEGHSV